MNEGNIQTCTTPTTTTTTTTRAIYKPEPLLLLGQYTNLQSTKWFNQIIKIATFSHFRIMCHWNFPAVFRVLKKALLCTKTKLYFVKMEWHFHSREQNEQAIRGICSFYNHSEKRIHIHFRVGFVGAKSEKLSIKHEFNY